MSDKTIILNGIAYKLVPVNEQKKEEKKEDETQEPIMKEAEQPEPVDELAPAIEHEESEEEQIDMPAPTSPPPPPPEPAPMAQARQPKLEKVNTTTIDGTRIYEYKRPRIRVDKDGNNVIVYSTIRRVYTPHQRNDARRKMSDWVINYMRNNPASYEGTDAYDFYCQYMQANHQKPYAFNSFTQQMQRN